MLFRQKTPFFSIHQDVALFVEQRSRCVLSRTFPKLLPEHDGRETKDDKGDNWAVLAWQSRGLSTSEGLATFRGFLDELSFSCSDVCASASARA